MNDTLSSLPPTWIEAELGEVLPISYGKGLTAARRDSTGDVPVYGSSGIVGHHSTALIDGPALIIGRKGSVGEVHFSPGASWPIDTTYYAQGSEDTNLRYFLYLLISKSLGRLDRSTAIPGLSRDDYNPVRVAIAPLAEQRRIVDEIEKQLTRLDAAVAALERARANLKRYRAAVLKAACEGRLVPTEAELARAEGRDYETGEQLLTRILAERPSRLRRGDFQGPSDEVRELPSSWVAASVDQLVSERMANGRSVVDRDGGFPVLRLTALRHGRVELGERKAGAWTREEAERFLVQRDDFLVARGNGSLDLVGRGGLVEDEPDPVAYPDTLIRLRFAPEISTPFVRAIWDSRLVRRQIEKLAHTTAGINKVSQKDLAAITLPVPPAAEQSRIVGEIDRRFSTIQKLEDEFELGLRRAHRLRQSILKRAFEGKLVPQDPNDEPAAALLERIRAVREAGSNGNGTRGRGHRAASR